MLHILLTLVFIIGCMAAFFYRCKEQWATMCLKLFGLLGLVWIFFSAHMNGHHHAYYTYFAGVSGGAAVGILICLIVGRQLVRKLPYPTTKS
jgi:hypothetical protein